MGVLALLVILNTDFKGVWIPRWSINDHAKIFACLDGKFNHVFLQVFAAGEAYYPSQYAPSKIQSDAWLKEFLAEAHRRNIKVSAWLNIFYIWGFAPPPINPRHPINQSPDWFVYDELGRSIIDYGINELRHLGLEGYYLAPANPQVQTYLTNIVDELITTYDFDGIHLDYVRYPSHAFVYDKALRNKFMRKYYFDPCDLTNQPDQLKTRIGLWGFDDLNERFAEFTNQDLTLFISHLQRNIKSINPNLMISAAVKPDYQAAHNDFCQDWVNWLNSDLLDFVCLMAYTKNIKGILDRTLKTVKDPQKVAVGLGLFNSDAKTIKRQVSLVRELPFAGIVFFSYKELDKHREFLNTLK